MVWKMIFLFQGSILRFQLFPECIIKNAWTQSSNPCSNPRPRTGTRPWYSSIAVVVVGRHIDRPGSGARQSPLAFSMLLRQVFPGCWLGSGQFLVCKKMQLYHFLRFSKNLRFYQLASTSSENLMQHITANVFVVGTTSINDSLVFGVLAKKQRKWMERNQGLEVIL